MPTYYARGVTVRLGANSLARTVTSNIALKKGDTAKKQAKLPENELLNSTLLPERRVGFADDDHGFGLNWLGGAPFIQVQVGHDLFREAARDHIVQSATTHTSAHIHQQSAIKNSYANVSEPLALSLHVKTSDMTFGSNFGKHSKLHLKIEVFFNGLLSSCLFFPPYELRHGTKTHHHVFAGYRVDYLAERPWVILPPQTAADGSPRKASSSPSGEKRWKQICAALSKEADDRGADKNGRVPPTSDFLRALASLELQNQVVNLQQCGSRNFGIIDVVITAGEGRKVTSGTAYLTRPRRFKDENFPMDVSLRNLGAIAAVAEQENTSIVVRKEHDEDAESESDSDHEPRRKRRALNPVPSTMLCGHQRNFPLAQKTVAQDVQNKVSFMPLQEKPSYLLASAYEMLPSRGLPSRGLAKASQELPSFPERGSPSHKDYGTSSHRPPEQRIFGTPKRSYSIANSNVGILSTPHMRPSPYSFRLSDPVLSRDTPSSMMSLQSLDHAGFKSSPSRAAPQHADMRPTSSNPTPSLHEDVMASTSQRHAPPLSGVQDRRGSLDSIFRSPFIPSGPQSWPPALHLQPPPLNSLPIHSHLPNVLPYARPNVRHIGPISGDMMFPPPHDNRLSMQLPPTGLFTVPVKPRSSVSSSKKSHPTNLKMPQRGFLMKRLIITGKAGSRIVDHDWPIAKFIAAKEHAAVGGMSDNLSTMKVSAVTSTTIDSTNMPPAADQSQSAISAKITPVTIVSQTQKPPYELPIDAIKEPTTISTSNSQCVRPEILSDTLNKMDVKMKGTAATDPHLQPGDVKSTSTTSQPVVPQRRTTSATNILGVQGPKAVAFLYDDPEVMIREEQKARRSRISIKRSEKASTAVETVFSKLDKPDVPVEIADDQSSPLSSLATTPEPGFDVSSVTRQLTPVILSRHNVSGTIEQMDGSSERALSTITLSKPASSLKKLASKTVTLSPTKATDTAESSSSSPNTKKRRFDTGRYLPKQPRSPDRLKTASNPPLNRDCVIAFAESEDKDSERGILRQVKSERQGVFTEEYVVFASRFYIAGN